MLMVNGDILLHNLRNPYGRDEVLRRCDRNEAADVIEMFLKYRQNNKNKNLNADGQVLFKLQNEGYLVLGHVVSVSRTIENEDGFVYYITTTGPNSSIGEWFKTLENAKKRRRDLLRAITEKNK